jgi:hypothetical protein
MIKLQKVRVGNREAVNWISKEAITLAISGWHSVETIRHVSLPVVLKNSRILQLVRSQD